MKEHQQQEKILELLEQAYQIRIKDLKTSMRLADEALALSKACESPSLIAQSLSKISLFHMILGEYEEATKTGNEALSLFEDIGDHEGIANVKYNIAGVLYKTDNYHLALVYLIDCLETFELLNDQHNQARVHKAIGTIYEFFGDEKSAVDSYEKSISSAQKVNDLNLTSNVYNPLSGIYLNRGNEKKAMELIESSMSMKKQTGDIRGTAFALYGKAKIYAKQKKHTLAEQVFKESAQIHEEMGERLGLGMCFYKLGALYLDIGELDKAATEVEYALKFSNEHNISMIKFKCNHLMYRIFKEKGDPIKALKYLEIYLKEKEAVINTQTLKVIESYEAISAMERLQKEAEMQKEKAKILEKKNRAEESSRVKQEFLSTMSHEIRTPLNAVITITSLLEEIEGDKENELLQSLKFSSNNLLRIINDILDFSKLDAGKEEVEEVCGDFPLLFENVHKTYKSLALEKGIRLNLKLDKNVSQFYWFDHTKVMQILGNLITNSIKFTDTGHVDIDIKRKRSFDEFDRIEINIVDTGKGIPESFIGEIFESFSQPKSYTTKKYEGSGLGLAIVKKLVDLHGSTIQVESIEGQGSRFFFDILLKKGETVHSKRTEIFTELIDKSVLLAEDNMVNALVSTKLLSNWGMNVTHAKDGIEVTELAKEKKFDFILMDIHMPELDGFDAAQIIKKSSNPNKKTPIFALTADITASQRKLFAPYFNGFLLKPIEREKLYHALLDSWSTARTKRDSFSI
ncbi:MAG: tetratricopeptide repeat protein [Cyclobacteriaceae bacterium]